MHLSYLLAGFSLILIQYATSALPVTNKNDILQRPSLIKHDNKVHLVKRKKHHRADGYYLSKNRGRYQVYDDDDYPMYEGSDYDRHDDYFNPRYSSGHSSYENAYMNSYYGSPYPMAYTGPIGTVNPASYPTIDPSMMNSVTPASIIPNSAPVADTPNPNLAFTTTSSEVAPPAP